MYPPPRRFAFTLIELLVVLAIIAILAAIFMPLTAAIQRRARGTQCLNQIRQMGLAARLYANDNDQTLPVTTHQRTQGGQSWSLTLQAYAGGKIIFRCPTDENATRTYTYVINDFLTPNPAGATDLDFSRLSRLQHAADTILFTEASKTYTASDHFHFAEYRGQQMPPDVFADQVAVERHAKAANYVFADAHAENLTWKQVQSRLGDPHSRFFDPTVEDASAK